MPSPSQVNRPLSVPPKFSDRMPEKPTMQPMIFFTVMRSLLKKMQARMTTEKTLSELRMAAREPSLWESPK